MARVAVMWNWKCLMEFLRKSSKLEEKRRAIPLHHSNLCPPTLLPTTLRKLIPLSANFTKRSNTLKQFIGKLPTNCLSVFDHFVKLALKGYGLHEKSQIFSICIVQNAFDIQNIVQKWWKFTSTRIPLLCLS